ncbi:MAG TPA: hypothetical protein VMV90_16045 [Rectinemataceae bacterium]|nr:hypothetical protein [Rectinemataceae bacterium]
MKLMTAATAAAAMLLVLAGCPSPVGAGSSESANGSAGGTLAEASSLFVPDAQTGSYDFSTNDSAYWGPNGYTLWTLSSSQTPFAQRDVVLTKTSGNAYAGYGIVFCEYDSGDAAHDETMLVVMINTQAQYSVGVATGSSYTAYTSSTWLSSNYLAKGLGMANEVKVTRDASGLFTLYLNGVEVMSFRDGRTPLQMGGGDGYLAVISPQDSFPQTPVTIIYKEK